MEIAWSGLKVAADCLQLALIPTPVPGASGVFVPEVTHRATAWYRGARLHDLCDCDDLRSCQGHRHHSKGQLDV